MSEANCIQRIADLVAAWNRITGQTVNAMRIQLDEQFCQQMLKAQITVEEMELIARYILHCRKQASEKRFMRALSIWMVISGGPAKLESELQTAAAIFREKPKTAKEKFVDGLPIAFQTHGIKQADEGNTTLARQAVADGLRQLSQKIEKGN